jgi:hypothetical protein
MSGRISRLCDELRTKLHGIDRRLEALKSNGVATFDKSQDVLESRLDRVEQRIYDNRVTVEAANVRVKAWLAEKRAGSVAGSPLWTERRKAHVLEARAMMLRPTPLPSSSLRLQRQMKPHWLSCKRFSRETMLMSRFCARRSLYNVYYRVLSGA